MAVTGSFSFEAPAVVGGLFTPVHGYLVHWRIFGYKNNIIDYNQDRKRIYSI